MCLGDENMLMKSEKKSKRRKKSARTSDLGVAKDNFKAVENDLSFKEEKLSFVDTRKERDKTKMETKAPRESKDRDTKRKKERGGGKQHGESSKNYCEDAVKNVVKKKSKLDNEPETMHDALVDGKTIAYKTANGTCDTEAVETLCKGSARNAGDEVKRKKRKKEKRKIEGVNLGHNSKNLPHERSEIRARFSCNVQVYPSSSDPIDEKHGINEENLLQGKRLTREEDETITDAVYAYIEAYNLGEKGLQKVLDCQSNQLRGCWKKITAAIPYRPSMAVYQRAQCLFRRGERKWTDLDYEMVRKFHGEYGPKWRVLADELGRHPDHVCDAWRRIKLDWKKGKLVSGGDPDFV